MVFFALSLFLLTVISVSATNLTCLSWDAVHPDAGPWCFVSRDTQNDLEIATVAAIQNAVEGADTASGFDISQHAITLSYQDGDAYGQSTGKNGTLASVSVKFGSGLAGTLVSIYELTYWNDVCYCLLDGAANLQPQVLGDVDPAGLDVVHSCTDILLEPNNIFTQVAIFNVTDGIHPISTSISTIASLLVPVGTVNYTEWGPHLMQGGFSLAVPGGATAGRVYKQDGDFAVHFEDEAETEVIKEQLVDPAWADENCQVCEAPGPTDALHPRESLNGRRLQGRHFGASGLSLCCIMPSRRPRVQFSLDEPGRVRGRPGIPRVAMAVYDPKKYQASIEQSYLLKPPSYQLRDFDTDATTILADIAQHNTATSKWSEDMLEICDSKDLFKLLRTVFDRKTTEAEEAFEIMGITEIQDPRFETNSHYWRNERTDNTIVKRLQAFEKIGVQHAIENVKAIANLSDVENSMLDGDLDFYFIEEGYGEVNPDERGFHIDGGVMQFGAADQPGLIIENAEGQPVKLEVLDDAFYLMKCGDWGGKKTNALRHSVFGPEIVKNGRVSMIVNVFKNPHMLQSTRVPVQQPRRRRRRGLWEVSD